jgi:hypothetical protein
MLESLAKRTDQDFNKVVGVPRYAFAKLTNKWESTLRIRSGPPNLLSPPAQVLTFLLHLRHYTRPLLAAVYMDVGRTTIRETIAAVGEFFFLLLSPLISFGTYEDRKKASFKYYNDFITYLCDGSVQEIHATKDLADEGNFYSGKNHEHAVSLLIFANAQKRLLHLTPCIYGCVKDDDLLIRTAASWVPKLTPQDRGFGDLGFRISDENRAKHAITNDFRIYTPTGPHSSQEYKIFSKHRIAIENKIAQLKKWEACKQVIRDKIKKNTNLLQQQSKKWMTVGGLDVWKTDGYQDFKN